MDNLSGNLVYKLQEELSLEDLPAEVLNKRNELVNEYMDNLLMDEPSYYAGYEYSVEMNKIFIVDIVDKNILKNKGIDIPLEFQGIAYTDELLSKLSTFNRINFGALKEIPATLFSDWQNLTNISGEYIIAVDDEAFLGCANLKKIDFPRLRITGKRSFAGCMSLKEINFPVALHIGTSSFHNCQNLETVQLDNLKFCYGDSAFAFESCESLSKVSMHSLLRIPQGTFQGCHSLKSMCIPRVDFIGTCAFNGCDNLESIYFGNIQKIEENAFLNCSAVTDIYYYYKQEALDNIVIEGVAELDMFRRATIHYEYTDMK